MEYSKIEYQNTQERVVTEQDAKLLNEYYRVYFKNDKIKKRENIKDGVSHWVEYYLEAGENQQEIVENNKDIQIDIIVSQPGIVFKPNEAIKYWINETRTYDLGTLKCFTKYRFDDKGREICYQEYNLLTLMPILKSTEKVLYEGDELILRFDYNNDGTFNCAWGGNWIGNDHKQSIYYDEMENYFPGLLDKYPYYKNADLLPLA